jgi:serine/threonine protein kinase
MSAGAFCDELLKGRYKIIRILGTGGMGQTYIAEDTQESANTPCVVKLFKPASNDTNFLVTARRLFNTEAETLKKLQHPQIPRFLDYFEHNQQFYLVQEYIDGHSLRAEMPLGMRWSQSQTIEILEDLLPILDYIHSLGVIHRDIKPDNIIRRKDGKLVLIDFGAVKQIAASYGGANTQQGQSSLTVGIGTPGYMPTEQSRGKPRPCSDLYALGMVCIRGLTGLVPTQLQEDEDGEVIWRSHSRVSNDLAHILTNLVRYHFKQRYQSAKQVLEELRDINNTKTGIQEITEISDNPTKIAPYNQIAQIKSVSLDNSQSSLQEVYKKPKLLTRILNVGFLTFGLILSSGAAYLALKGTGKTMTNSVSLPSTTTASTSITKTHNIPHTPQPSIANTSVPNTSENKVDPESKSKVEQETEKQKILSTPEQKLETHPDKSSDSKSNHPKPTQPEEKTEPSFPNLLIPISDFLHKANEPQKNLPKDIKKESIQNNSGEGKNYEPIMLCVVTSDSYNVRSSPTTKSTIITDIKDGTKVSVVGERNNWFKITRPVEGWIEKDNTNSRCSSPKPLSVSSPTPINSVTPSVVPSVIPNKTKHPTKPNTNAKENNSIDNLPESVPPPVTSPSITPKETVPSPSPTQTPTQSIPPSPTPIETPESKTPESKAPESKTPESKAPESKAPESQTPENKAPENTSNQPSLEVIPPETPTIPSIPTQNTLETSPSPNPTEVPILVPSDNTSQTPASEMPAQMRKIPNLKHTTSEIYPLVMPSVTPSVTPLVMPSVIPSVTPSVIPIEPKVIFTKQPDITTPGEKISPVGNNPTNSPISFYSVPSASKSVSQ